MPKKKGINKTFSFSADVVEKLNDLSKYETRTQTNVIEVAIKDRWQLMMKRMELEKYGE